MPESYSAVLDARLVFEEVGDPTIDPGAVSSAVGNVEAQSGGRRWTNGTGSGKVGAAYKRIRTIGSGATDTYDLLAAGSLQTPLGRPIDLDELKALSLKVTSGEVKIIKHGTNGLDIFTSNNEGFQLKAAGGLRAVVLDMGPDGLDVSSNSRFEVVETSGAASATYEIAFIGAE
jgi:hypothetical protein